MTRILPTPVPRRDSKPSAALQPTAYRLFAVSGSTGVMVSRGVFRPRVPEAPEVPLVLPPVVPLVLPVVALGVVTPPVVRLEPVRPAPVEVPPVEAEPEVDPDVEPCEPDVPREPARSWFLTSSFTASLV